MKTAVFSIVSPNYRQFARVLMASAREHHPEWERFLLLVGDSAPPDLDRELFATVPVEALPLPDARRFFFRYTILELNTAVKPWMFEFLFARGFDRVIYLDPDIRLFSRLAELDESPEAFLTLTPHLTGPIAGDDHPSERSILVAGTYNLGFLCVTRNPQLELFLRWWQEKLEYQCVVDVARGLFVDQKWMDLTPGLFEQVRILRHDGYNVAYWNLRQRRLTVDRTGDGGVTIAVNGQPLRFFHFSGFDPGSRDDVSRHDQHLEASRTGDVSQLLDSYRDALIAAGYRTFLRARYSFGFFANGTRIPDSARVAYRNSPELQQAAGDDPFLRAEVFRRYRNRRKRPPLVARMALRSYRFLSQARPLVRLVPRRVRRQLRELLLGRRDSDSAAPPPSQGAAGLNVIGYLTHETGVGESARLCARAAEAAGLPVQLIDVESPSPEVLPLHGPSVFHVNADQTPLVHSAHPELFAASSYRIGCWHWELPELPDAWIASAAPLDEIWAPSAFIQDAVSRKVRIPVTHMPHGIEVTELEPCTPQELGVPAGRFTFLCMFDLASVMERKNPLGAIEAFRRAFPDGTAAALLIKAGHAGRYPEAYAELAEAVRGVPSVYLTSRMLPRPRVNGLLAACDAVLSLHRSEGFGLVLAEAMYLGKPVVATGWSGNMDFMTPANSCPVEYELVTLDRTCGYYEAGQQWASPDLDHAADLIRRVAGDEAFRTRLGARARETIRTRFSPAAAGMRYRRRLELLGLVGRSG